MSRAETQTQSGWNVHTQTAEPDDIVIHTSPTDPRAQPMFDDLVVEYGRRYAEIVQPGDLEAELTRYPPEHFAPPDGVFLLLLRGSETIGGGGFVRHDGHTAELKRIWTHNGYRRQGLARRVVETLEAEAERVGYRRICLSTGFRQPEAVALYLALGYQPLFDLDGDWQAIFSLPFEKHLARKAVSA